MFGKKNNKKEIFQSEEINNKEKETVVEENKKENNYMHYLAGVFSGLILSLIVVVCIYISNILTNNNDNLKFDNSQSGSIKEEDNSSKEENMSAMFLKEQYLLQMIDKYYYYDLDWNTIEEMVCDGLISALNDKYAQYYTKDEYAEIVETSSGKFCGIGVAVTQNADTKRITVTKPYKNSSGAKAGMKAGDIIIAVDHKDITDMELASVVALIKGEEGTEVSITVLRNNEKITMTMKREMVETDSVVYELIDDIEYIYIEGFEDNTPKQFNEALEDAKKNNAKGILFDLRNNPGGGLNSVVAMLDSIIDEGLLVYIEDKDGNRQEYNATSDKSVDIPMVCLVNQYSASAAELFTGTLQQYNKASIVGVTTYGKGVVQTLVPMSDGSAFKFTTSKYFIKGGINIDGTGIIPDVKAELNREAIGSDGTIIREMDFQFKAAVKELHRLIDEKK